MTEAPPRDPVRIVLAFAIVGGLAAVSVWIMKPFLPALVWSTMIVVATWPMMLAIEARLWRKRWLATAVMTLLLLLTFVIPLCLAILTIMGNIDVITGWFKQLQGQSFEVPPDWVGRIPIAGAWLADTWRDMAASGDFGKRITSSAGAVGAWFVSQIGDIGTVLWTFLLTLGISAILYFKGELAAAGAMRFARRIGGDRAQSSMILASKAIRGVALGVVLTALVQAVAGAIGLAITGVPLVAVFTAAMFMLSLAQIGPAPVLVCATIWLFWRGDTGWGVFLGVWTIVLGVLDNVVRPFFIRKGVDLPFLLLFVGAIGGLVAFGLVGIFVGPVVLAVTYKLLEEWVEITPRQNE